MDFANVYAQGFARVAARVLPVHLAQPSRNADAVIADVAALADQAVCVVAYPELNLTGYSCDDLFLQDVLLDASEDAVAQVVEASRHLSPVIIVGAPLRWEGRVHNCAIVIQGGVLVAVVPKSYLPTYREFYERRWFAPGRDTVAQISLARHPHLSAPMGAGQVITVVDVPGLVLGVEVCEDMWVPIPPHTTMAAKGATVVVNLSGSPITIGKADDRKSLAQSASARCQMAYVFTAAGPGESSTDLSWDGQTFVYECGELLGQSERFPRDAQGTLVDVDLRRIAQERLRQGTHGDNVADWLVSHTPDTPVPSPVIGQGRLVLPSGDLGLLRPVERFPFVPNDPARLSQDCYEAYNIQVQALARRMEAIGQPKLVIGISGGLDSTHALIVAAKAMDLVGRPRRDILAFTMPGFATSDTTKSSALALMEAVGATAQTLDIRPAATRMLTDLGHPFAQGEPHYDVTFENVQAGLRTDYLFRVANQRGGIVVGTGDLSELALGWCTYGVGDQMSHYAVNTGVPKTLMQFLIRWVISQELFDATTNEVLETILGQEISPELVPPADGKSMQSTESLIGPYALHDFFLWHVLRRGAQPSRVAYLAWQAWRDVNRGAWPIAWAGERKVSYDLATIRGWLEFFLKRFFANQFKRSAIPNGPKVSAAGTLSPRGDWRMPSDVGAATWLGELEDNVPREEL